MAAARSPSLLRSLRHRNYRLFFTGQSVSLIGTWVTLLATSWLVYRLTGSAFLLGLVGFCSQIAMLFLGPIAGVFVDRWDRRRVLVCTQALSALQSATLAVLTLSGIVTVWQVLVLQLVQGVIHAFDTPARQAFVITMLDDRADLSNAIALNSIMVNGSRIVGPAVGGAMVAAVGEGWCFALDAVSYLAVIGSLVAMRLPARDPAPAGEPVVRQLAVGFRYVRSFAPIRTALYLIAAVSVFGIPLTVLMPVMASEVLGGGSYTLGVMIAAFGLGALTGAVYLASRSTVVGLGRAIGVATLLYGASLVAVALSRNFYVSLPLLLLAGSGFMTAIAASNTLIQTLVQEDLRGRVMAFYTMAFLGTMPIGSLAAGIIAEQFGAPATIAGGGVLCFATGIWFFLQLPSLRAVVRPIYIERGILTP
jgi:MFS family permease